MAVTRLQPDAVMVSHRELARTEAQMLTKETVNSSMWFLGIADVALTFTFSLYPQP